MYLSDLFVTVLIFFFFTTANKYSMFAICWSYSNDGKGTRLS